MKQSIQKLIQVGDSYAVLLPNSFINHLDLKVGDKVVVEYDDKEKLIRIKPALGR